MSSRHRSPSPRRRDHRRSPSPPRRRDERDRASSTSSRPATVKKETDLPTEFTRDHEDEGVRDDKNVLERMEKAYVSGPLQVLSRCTKEQLKLKIWTRNFKQMRGICTGYLVAFDKHWNLALKDVDEIGIIPKKGKTPYLRDLKPGDAETIPEAKPKQFVEKPKKTPEEIAAAEEAAKAAQLAAKVKAEPGAEGEEGKKKRRRKKKKTKITRRHVNQLFIRGDNIVMLSIIAPSEV